MENERKKQQESKENEDAKRQPKKRYVAPEVTVLGDVTQTRVGGGCGCGCGGGPTS